MPLVRARGDAHYHLTSCSSGNYFRKAEEMLGIVLGILAVVLGAKAFTKTGLPLTREKSLTGVSAKVIGVICIVLGAAFILDGLLASFSIFALFSGN